MEDRTTFISLIVTTILFIFIFMLIYTIYCFVYYDKHQEEIYLNYYNEKKYDKIFYNLDDIDNLTLDEFNNVISLMYNKNNLENIYDTYYSKSNYESLMDFINDFYYGNKIISNEDISFVKEGETNYFKRAILKYDEINVSSDNGIKSALGVFKNLSLNIENNGRLYLDNDELYCENSICNVSNVFGGLHTIRYISNGYEYFGIINVVSDDLVIYITSLKSLVTVN